MNDVKKPSEKVIANAYDGKEITDSQGRKLRLRKPDILDFYDLMSAIGEDAKNPTCQAMANNVLYIATIDGQVITSPKSYREFRATLARIGESGILALAEFMSSLDTSENREKEQLEKIKKS